MSSQVQHSRIGASSCARWWNCPGSLDLIEKTGSKNTTSKDAARGTAAHEIAEFYLKARTRVDDHWLGNRMEVDGFTIIVDQALLDGVSVYVDWALDMIEEFGFEDDQIFIEKGFHLPSIHSEAYGTCDLLFLALTGRLYVADLKNGRGIVEVKDNYQTRYYALGAYLDLPREIREWITDIALVIVQPNAEHEDGYIRMEVITKEELLKWGCELKAAADRATSGEGELNAGDHCRWCPAKGVCEEFKNSVQRAAQVDFADVDLQLPSPTTMKPEDIARLMGHASLIKEWCDSVIAYGHTLAETGVEIPGYKLVDKRSNRVWTNEKAVVEQLEPLLGDELYKKKLISPKGVEDWMKRNKEKIDGFGSLYHKPVAGKTLTVATDPRPKRLADVVEDFKDVVIDI